MREEGGSNSSNPSLCYLRLCLVRNLQNSHVFLGLRHVSLPPTHVNQYCAVSADIINTVSIVSRVWHVKHVIIVFKRSDLYCAKKKTKKWWFLSPGKMSSAHARQTAIVFLVRLPCVTFGNATTIEYTYAQDGRNFAVLHPTCRCSDDILSFQILSIRDPQGTGNWFFFSNYSFGNFKRKLNTILSVTFTSRVRP